jgi:putative effector of murein hydrolase LrgA (UPF0299 family)
MDSLLLLLLGVAVIALVLIIGEAVMRYLQVPQPARWIALVVLLIVLLLFAWPRVGW